MLFKECVCVILTWQDQIYLVGHLSKVILKCRCFFRKHVLLCFTFYSRLQTDPIILQMMLFKNTRQALQTLGPKKPTDRRWEGGRPGLVCLPGNVPSNTSREGGKSRPCRPL